MNKELFLYLNSFAHYSNLLDFIVIAFAQYTPFIFIIIEIYIYFFKRLKIEAIFAFYSMLIALFINQIIGLFYFHNRPFMDNIGVVLKSHVAESSFPSDHTTFMFAILFSFLFYKKTKKYILFLFILALIGGFARVIIGVHYPYDIFGGILTGFVGALIIYLTKDKFKKLNKIILKVESIIFKDTF